MIDLSSLTDRNELGFWLNANGLTGIGAEIGVAYGENAEQILSFWQGSGMFLIDPWNREACGDYVDGSAQIDFDGAYNHAINRLSRFVGRTIILRMTSNEALKMIPDGMLDFVYIDGNHHNPQFRKDLVQWTYKVKVGGLIGGHDYYDFDEPHYKCEVKKTVDHFVKEHKIKLHTTCSRELDQSWWFINFLKP